MSTLEILVKNLSFHGFISLATRGDSSGFIWLLVAADRRAQFETLEYTDDEYQKELEHIEKVKPLYSIFDR